MAYQNRWRGDDRGRHSGDDTGRGSCGGGYDNNRGYGGGFRPELWQQRSWWLRRGYAGDYGRGGSSKGYGGVFGPEDHPYDAGYGADVRSGYAPGFGGGWFGGGLGGMPDGYGYGYGFGPDYNRAPFGDNSGGGAWGSGYGRYDQNGGRVFMDRASDEVASWFGDDKAE